MIVPDHIEILIREIHTNTAVMRQRLEDHMSNETVHQVPPCETARRIEDRQWRHAATGGFLGALAGAAASVASKIWG